MTRFRTIRRHRKRPAPLDEVAVYEHVAAAFRRPGAGAPQVVFMVDEVAALHDPATRQHLAVAESLISTLLAKGHRR